MAFFTITSFATETSCAFLTGKASSAVHYFLARRAAKPPMLPFDDNSRRE
jgi:hypothetical protein